MTETLPLLPIRQSHCPADQQELIAVVRSCCRARTPIYPIGGGTSLDFGLPAKQPGVGLSLASLDRVVDYPARDMTITVEAGVAMQKLAETLAREGQHLPFDVPHADRATIGGVVATNFNGPRRYGLGTVRDHVIGVSAVDGRGMPFKGGGRVVKNVAGYDFCKLMTGSLGTLGVISQLTLRLRPLPETSMLLTCDVADLDQAERLLACLACSDVTPSAIELLGGPAWNQDGGADLVLAVALEGTSAEVDWMTGRLGDQWRELGVVGQRTVEDTAAKELWQRLAEFPAGEAPLVVKAAVRPSCTTSLIDAARRMDGDCSFQAHAGNGVVIVRFSEFPPEGLTRALVGSLQAEASSAGGSVVILSNPSGGEMTRQAAWGTIGKPLDLMRSVKRQFDPHNLLNPGRFVFP